MSAARRRAPARLALALLCVAAAFACRSVPVAWRPVAAGDPRGAGLVAALRALGAERHALRATGRVATDGPHGAGASKQLLLVERPASLRVEVIGGILEQRVLVLATDGERYDLYRAEAGGGFETGEVHPGVLHEAAGLPLEPEAAAALLLAAPRVPDAEPVVREAETGELALSWPDRTFEFDANGRLAALALHPDGREVLRARWSEWRDAAGAGGSFPHRLDLEVLEPEASFRLDYREVELDPALAPELFRLRPAGR